MEYSHRPELVSCCPVVSRSPKRHQRHQSWCKEAGLAVLQWRVPVMNCKSLTSSKWTARLGHSSKSCESACPYLVQGTHSFKGNGKGWSLQRCQSRVTQTSYYSINVYIETSSWYFCFSNDSNFNSWELHIGFSASSQLFLCPGPLNSYILNTKYVINKVIVGVKYKTTKPMV